MKRSRTSPPACRRRGTVLIVLMVFLLVTVSIAIAVMRAALVDARQFNTDAKSLQADRLAEAGIARALSLRTTNAEFTGDEWQIEFAGREPGVVRTQVSTADERVTIESVATYPASGDRRVQSRRQVILEQSNL